MLSLLSESAAVNVSAKPYLQWYKGLTSLRLSLHQWQRPPLENADPAQDTTPLNISAYEKDLTPIDLDLPLLTPNS